MERLSGIRIFLIATSPFSAIIRWTIGSGPKFTRLVAEFILNSAIVAEEKGYRVSKEEAWADLVQNASVSFQDISRRARHESLLAKRVS